MTKTIDDAAARHNDLRRSCRRLITTHVLKQAHEDYIAAFEDWIVAHRPDSPTICTRIDQLHDELEDIWLTLGYCCFCEREDEEQRRLKP